MAQRLSSEIQRSGFTASILPRRHFLIKVFAVVYFLCSYCVVITFIRDREKQEGRRWSTTCRARVGTETGLRNFSTLSGVLWRAGAMTSFTRVTSSLWGAVADHQLYRKAALRPKLLAPQFVRGVPALSLMIYRAADQI